MDIGGVYIVRHKHSDRFYVGSTISFRRRKAQHWLSIRSGKGESRGLVAFANSVGNNPEDFSFEPLLICDTYDRKLYEQRAIDVLYELKGCLNLSKMGGGHSPVTCALISAILKTKPSRIPSAKTRRKMSEAGKRRPGRPMSPATREKIRAGVLLANQLRHQRHEEWRRRMAPVFRLALEEDSVYQRLTKVSFCY